MPARASDLAGLVALLKLAAARLGSAGLDFGARLRLLRGIYYGTTHSLDFEKRRSGLRNLGFNLYLRSWPPADPSPLLGAELVRALKDSSEIRHAGCAVDIGHVFVGLEARSHLSTRRLNLIAQGGTGLELVTWVGDLGGAAGLLAVERMDRPAVGAMELLFSADSYDLSANLEGDLAGYLVGRKRGAGPRPTPPDLERFPSIADALQGYLSDPPGASDWSRRHELFIRMIGGSVVEGRIDGRETLARMVFEKTRSFASFYVLYRLKFLGRLSASALAEASRHVRGAAAEVSEVFVGRLERGVAHAQARRP
ncbi:MAG TPA: hypothetical protein VK914_12845 [bacterium]|nr:hypothetical protein [bacterium]